MLTGYHEMGPNIMREPWHRRAATAALKALNRAIRALTQYIAHKRRLAYHQGRCGHNHEVRLDHPPNTMLCLRCHRLRTVSPKDMRR